MRYRVRWPAKRILQFVNCRLGRTIESIDHGARAIKRIAVPADGEESPLRSGSPNNPAIFRKRGDRIASLKIQLA